MGVYSVYSNLLKLFIKLKWKVAKLLCPKEIAHLQLMIKLQNDEITVLCDILADINPDWDKEDACVDCAKSQQAAPKL